MKFVITVLEVISLRRHLIGKKKINNTFFPFFLYSSNLHVSQKHVADSVEPTYGFAPSDGRRRVTFANASQSNRISLASLDAALFWKSTDFRRFYIIRNGKFKIMLVGLCLIFIHERRCVYNLEFCFNLPLFADEKGKMYRARASFERENNSPRTLRTILT